MYATNDTPVTDKELEAFYGKPATDYEWADACQRHTAAYDKDDLTETSWEFEREIISALEAGDLQKVGEIYAIHRANTIAKRVALELTGSAA